MESFNYSGGDKKYEKATRSGFLENTKNSFLTIIPRISKSALGMAFLGAVLLGETSGMAIYLVEQSRRAMSNPLVKEALECRTELLDSGGGLEKYILVEGEACLDLSRLEELKGHTEAQKRYNGLIMIPDVRKGVKKVIDKKGYTSPLVLGFGIGLFTLALGIVDCIARYKSQMDKRNN